MHIPKIAVAALSVAGLATGFAVWQFTTASDPVVPDATRALGRQTLAQRDGWAAESGGTTGGTKADEAHTFLVRTRQELIAALGGDNAANGKNTTPRMVFLSGVIDLNVDEQNQPKKCESFADPGYTTEVYQTTFDPAKFGRKAKPSGPVEEARAKSAKAQQEHIKINVGSNTTLVGLTGAVLRGGTLSLDKVSNVIIRNIDFQNVIDCFPAWDPTDAEGKWKPQVDLVSLTGATRVWIDHNTLSDGDYPDENLSKVYDRPYRVHDGAIDITKGSDLVTVSYNDFHNHDNVMLIGGSDTEPADKGKLRVTVHHNRFNNVVQRAPRVRFGQVDVFNNLYILEAKEKYLYSIGVGIESKIHVENNFFRRHPDVPAARIVENFKGSAVTFKGSLVQVGGDAPAQVNVLDAYNAVKNPDLAPDTGFSPTLRAKLDPTADVPALVERSVGVGRVRL